jgi:GNAT superfamily N-acetyltransferase
VKVSIRNATLEDHLLYLRLLPELGVDDPPPDAAKWANELKAATLVAERGGEPVGVCTYFVLEGSGHIRALMVDPKARRVGAGRALLEEVSKRLRAAGCGKWTLNVKPHNVAAIGLYVSLGFARDYSSQALRLPWSVMDALPPSPPVSARVVAPSDDRELEKMFSLSAGQIEGMRKTKRLLLTLTDAAGSLLALAAYDPTYPGAFPFRVKELPLARALLQAMKPHALPGAEWTGVVVENDDALAKLLIAHGASVRMDIDHYAGLLSPSPFGRGSG